MIILGKTFRILNVVSRREQIKVPEFQNSIKLMLENYSENLNSSEVYIITSTHNIYSINDEQMLDTEILVPVYGDQIYKKTDILKPKIEIMHALHKRVDDISKLQDTLHEINKYLVDNKLRQITSGYLVQRKEINQIVVDIYVGLDPNIT